ncbi:MAG: CHC2 zinc finger domain-containing protein, partial [Acidobacteriota bacterium]
MRGFPQDSSVQDVRAAADLARLISDYVPLRNSGRKLKGLCPFHQEKTPSFTVDPDKGLFDCFGCRTGGDLFEFYMRVEGVGFADALRDLAARFGVPLKARQGGRSGEAGRLVEMHRRAAAFYRTGLTAGEGRQARRYLRDRGLGEETISRLEIGL